MRKLLFIALVGTQLPLASQAPLHYRYTSTSTSYTDKAVFDQQVASLKTAGIDVTEVLKTNGAMVNKTISMVSLTTRDSAGGTLWALTIDTSMSEPGPYMQAVMKRAEMTARPPTATPPVTAPRPPTPKTVYQVFVLNGRPVSFERNGKPMSTPIVPQHSAASLWTQLPGYALLIPNADLPAKVGEVKPDTFGIHTKTAATAPGTAPTGSAGAGSGGGGGGGRAAGAVSGLSAGGNGVAGNAGGTVTFPGMPATETSDTTVAEWKRTSADTVDANVSRLATRETDASLSTQEIIGTFQIIYDASHAVRNASSSLTTTTTTLNTKTSTPPTVRTSMQEYSVVRVP